ncbi:MAG TPA: glycosyl transferase [Bdellovibrionales bacterium]|nr:MAG: hypothetical protein A2Z97_06875 [Bdellovibrionales bacterium GWB1_52_6]OFZ05470.1 MAG: hypothetical protein A2X97_11375 [Bdellovibrionales bacterium GWA1_52_35]OFZ40454.1 MAG: hypothetical protein A2070_07455 [Bdellovibrionales bacterium GWC1_52_8]HAR42438.1 glycosyl transferase [Bdellovibrionales bacterium]HCM39166.1 glycosyl transferase [Bdellovibrionales bacterium]
MTGRLSIIIPVLNEARTLPELLRRVNEIDLPVEKEIIIVDNGSTDGSRELIAASVPAVGQGRVLMTAGTRGKGAAVREGLKLATGDIILIQDADLEYSPADYPRLIEPLISRRADFVLGSRFLGVGTWKVRVLPGQPGYSFVLNLGALFLNAVFLALYRVRLTDPQTMFKVFRKSCLDGIVLQSSGFDLDWEILCKLVLAGYRPMELPVSYQARSFQQGKKIRIWADGWSALWAIIKFHSVLPF